MLEAGKVLDLSAIKAILPHRNPNLMLDRVQVIDENNLVGLKNLSINEPFFQGHFPGHPIMPGVLQIEAMKQLGEIAVRGKLDPSGNNDVYLWKLAKAKFRNPNVPGDRAKVEISVVSIEDGAALINGTVSNSGGITCEAQFSLKMREKSAPTAMPELFTDNDRAAGYAKEIGDVISVMPHRFPFLLIDYVAKVEDSKIIAVKNISANENFIDAGFDTVPDSLMCEIAAQSGCASVLSRPENEGKLGFFMAIDKAVFFRQVCIGEQMIIEIDLPPSKSRFGKGSGVIRVGEEVVAEIALMFAIVEA